MPPQTPNKASLSQIEEQRANWNRPSRNFVMLAVGGCFLAVYFQGFARPLVDAVKARNWQPTHCTLLESALQEHSDDEGTPTFSVAVKYGYFAKSVSDVGAPNYFVGTRYDFQSGADSDLEHWSKLATSLRPGSACTCYVNPAEASRLFWYTEGKAYFQAVVLAAETTIATSKSAGQAPFSLRFPAAPTPYRSDSLTIAWALEAIARPSGIVNRVDLRTAEPTASSTELVG